MNRIYSLVATALVAQATDIFNPSVTTTFDLEDSSVLSVLQTNGLEFTSYSHFTVQVKDIPSTGYLWHAKIIPEDCFSVDIGELVTDDEAVGTTKFKTFHLEPESVNRELSSCTLALA